MTRTTKIATTFAAIGLALAVGSAGMAIPPEGKASRAKAAPNREIPSHDASTLLVRMKPGAGRLQAPGVASTRAFRVPPALAHHDIARWRVVTVQGRQDLRRVRENLLRNPNVELVEFNYDVHADLVPDDPDFGELWGLNNTGQTGGVVDADIDAVEAWDVAGTGEQILVAVIDTGIDYTHPDLEANIWTNPGEIPDNGIDDDGNGYVDDVHGYDFAYDDGDPMDAHGHGTHVSGTIGAVRNNGLGVAGVTGNVRLMAAKFLNDSGSGSTSDAVDALLYATTMGARLSNNSWGGGGFSQALYDAIAAADAAGSLFIAAAGNSATDNDATPHYPSSYDLPNVVAVASTDANDNLSSFSCYGETSVDLGAPGSSIWSTVPGGGYGSKSGTSMATPHVSGAAALILSQMPGLSPQSLRDRLMGTVDPLQDLQGKVLSGGRLNLSNALENDTLAPATVQDLNVTEGGAFSLNLSWTASGDDGMSGQASRYRIHYAKQPFDLTTLDLTNTIVYPASAPAGSLESAGLTDLDPSTVYYVGIVAVDNLGNASALSPLAQGSTAQLYIGFTDDFESGLGNWTIEGSDGLGGPALWHVSQHRAASPDSALYYGIEASLTYDNGAAHAGTVTSVPLLIPVGGILRFHQYAQTESLSPYDEMSVQISVADGTWDTLLTRNSSTDTMVAEMIDLSAYATQKVRIRFSFDTKDAVANGFEGWVIDDVSILGTEAPDTIAPAPIQDLSASPEDGAVILDWSATGDDGFAGTATAYELRYMTTPIDNGNFAMATPVDGLPAPSAAGTPETFMIPIGVLQPSTEYWVAIRAIDEWGNASDVNTVSVTTGPESVVSVLSEGFDTGAVGWYMEGNPGLWHISQHRYLSPSSALYYGIEGALNFDTGDVNFGTATSPAIDLTDKTHTMLRFSDYRQAETGGNWDVSLVQVAPIGEPWTTVWQADYMSDVDIMTEHQVDLSAYDGSVIQVRFSFDSGDGSANFGEGWLIDDVRVEAVSVNQMPVPVLSGPSVVAAGEALHFDASGSYDPEGAALTYSWAVDGLPLANVENWLDYTFESGSHVVTVTVSDGTDSQPASQIVRVNNPPTAQLTGPAATPVGLPAVFDAGASADPDGDPLSYAWFVAGVPAESGSTLSYTFAERGEYLVKVEVSDGYASSQAEMLVVVDNVAPTALITGPVSGTRANALTFDGSGSSDADGHTLSYAWTVDGVSAGSGATLTYTFSSLGAHQVELTVSDGFDSNSASRSVLIENVAPVAQITGPASGSRVDILVFDGSGSVDQDGDPLTYSWTIDGAAAGNGPTLSYTFGSLGTYQVGLTVSDGFDSSSATHQVVIGNIAPTAVIVGPASGTRLDTLVFDGSTSSDTEGASLTYSWTINGAPAGNGPILSHTFSSLGTYEIGLTVSDGAASNSATHQVVIGNIAPTAEIAGPASGTRLDTLTFDGSGSDAEGDPLTYSWTVDGNAAGTGTSLTYTFSSVGVHELALTISDGFDSHSVSHQVVIENIAPSGEIVGPATGTRLDALVFDGSGSTDAEGDALTHTWTIDGAPAGTAPTLTHTFGTVGTHQVELTVSDGFDSHSVSHQVAIENIAPSADAGPDLSVSSRDTVVLNGTASDPDGTIASAVWQQTSGTAVDLSQNGLSVSFTAPKLTAEKQTTLTFELTVTDSDGATATDQVTVIVNK